MLPPLSQRGFWGEAGTSLLMSPFVSIYRNVILTYQKLLLVITENKGGCPNVCPDDRPELCFSKRSDCLFKIKLLRPGYLVSYNYCRGSIKWVLRWPTRLSKRLKIDGRKIPERTSPRWPSVLDRLLEKSLKLIWTKGETWSMWVWTKFASSYRNIARLSEALLVTTKNKGWLPKCVSKWLARTLLLQEKWLFKIKLLKLGYPVCWWDGDPVKYINPQDKHGISSWDISSLSGHLNYFCSKAEIYYRVVV